MSLDQQTKRHHFVPKAYLKAFCDLSGRLHVYRKDAPQTPLYVAPDATQFRRYYYSQQTADGRKDNNTLEAFFSNVEAPWPAIVARLSRREDVNDSLETILNFIALQRARVPASRDLAEAMMAQTVKDTMQDMLRSGKLPPPPAGLNLEDVNVAIDPHRSLQSMVSMLQGIGELFSMMGFAAVHNTTTHTFLTSDNPVLWFDPLLPFEEQRPYTIDPERAEVILFFPVTPSLAIVGASSYKQTYASHGLLHSDVPDEAWVNQMNAQTCRFAYEAIIAQGPGHEDMIASFADVSPVHEAVSAPMAKGIGTVHRQVFGPRTSKPKWRAG